MAGRQSFQNSAFTTATVGAHAFAPSPRPLPLPPWPTHFRDCCHLPKRILIDWHRNRTHKPRQTSPRKSQTSEHHASCNHIHTTTTHTHTHVVPITITTTMQHSLAVALLCLVLVQGAAAGASLNNNIPMPCLAQAQQHCTGKSNPILCLRRLPSLSRPCLQAITALAAPTARTRHLRSMKMRLLSEGGPCDQLAVFEQGTATLQPGLSTDFNPPLSGITGTQWTV